MILLKRAEQRVQVVEQVDDFRTADLVTVALRLPKELPLFGDRLGVTVSADLFNALNDGTVVRRELQLKRRREPPQGEAHAALHLDR